MSVSKQEQQNAIKLNNPLKNQNNDIKNNNNETMVANKDNKDGDKSGVSTPILSDDQMSQQQQSFILPATLSIDTINQNNVKIPSLSTLVEEEMKEDGIKNNKNNNKQNKEQNEIEIEIDNSNSGNISPHHRIVIDMHAVNSGNSGGIMSNQNKQSQNNESSHDEQINKTQENSKSSVSNQTEIQTQTQQQQAQQQQAQQQQSEEDKEETNRKGTLYSDAGDGEGGLVLLAYKLS